MAVFEQETFHQNSFSGVIKENTAHMKTKSRSVVVEGDPIKQDVSSTDLRDTVLSPKANSNKKTSENSIYFSYISLN